ncbi:hypothetical protein A3J36_00540 [Candidatus Uhrbacteria bacterium RIFCSPLOWO2_02_FULL_54_37]|uniref:HTH deoR-type domain-containing protein n=1 Tax=Candidatus Uhrbacteria bacterium RIFCSPLOWO2_02_FULL_54_37 TaxID=1802412 RepID=A0A1F7VIS8_9BACT|nr:MAG: hypothetical protein A3J36_00540 [Candidatus Uhrbacteria bacterium RIFCSPLOWO2_02_FULL_54_37]
MQTEEQTNIDGQNASAPTVAPPANDTAAQVSAAPATAPTEYATETIGSVETPPDVTPEPIVVAPQAESPRPTEPLAPLETTAPEETTAGTSSAAQDQPQAETPASAPTRETVEVAQELAQSVEAAPPPSAVSGQSGSSSSRPERGDPFRQAQGRLSAEFTLNKAEGLGMTSEKIIERVRELSEQEKEQMFRDKLKSLSPRGVSARRGKRQANLDKIIAHLRKHGYIANNEVEKLCKVSDATAERYLSALEEQGLILKLGRPGRGMRYRLREAIS